MYKGMSVPIPLGSLGLKTDDSMTSLPPNAAIVATNVDFESSRVEKCRGASKYNASAMDAAVVCLKDWWPDGVTQRLIAITANGKIWRDTGAGSFSAIRTLTTTTIDQCMMVEGGAEATGQRKKLFMFTGTSQVHVGATTADFTTTAAIATPAADWTGSDFPTGGCIFQNKLVTWGVAAFPHAVYYSSDSDHEVFTGAGTGTFNIFPGEQDGILTCVPYKNNLFVFKKPLGVYMLNSNNSSDPADWSIQKLSDSFGIGSPHVAIQVLDDLWVGNVNGSVTSLQASDALGGAEAGDVYALAQVEQYMKEALDDSGTSTTTAVYYAEKKRAMFTAKSEGGSALDRLVVIDVARQQPRFRIYDAFSPNVIALRRNSNGVQRPIYGTTGGFVYLMESTSYNVGDSTAYSGIFQTPYMDMSFADPRLAGKNKLYDFLEIQYLAAGQYNFYIDVYIDGDFSETLTISQSVGAVLDSFTLDEDTLGGAETTRYIRKPLHGSGRTISFKIYNNSLNQTFRVEKLVVNFRASAEQQSFGSSIS